jgi:hypothetical protein
VFTERKLTQLIQQDFVAATDIRSINSIVLEGNAMNILSCELLGESRFAVLFLGYAAPERASEGSNRRMEYTWQTGGNI